MRLIYKLSDAKKAIYVTRIFSAEFARRGKKYGNQFDEDSANLPPVSYRFAADIARAEIGDAGGIRDLSLSLKRASVNEMIFILQSLKFIKNVKSLREPKNRALRDFRIYENGQVEAVVKTPAGKIKYESFRQRLSDFAVDAFVERFQLKPNFDTSKNRCSKAEIAEVGEKLNRLLVSK